MQSEKGAKGETLDHQGSKEKELSEDSVSLPNPEKVSRDGKFRSVFQWLDPFRLVNGPPPTTASLDDAPLIPEATASLISRVTFDWITPILILGYNRPLESTDLWRLHESRSAKVIGGEILKSFYAQKEKADAYNLRLANGDIKPGWRAVWWTLRGRRADREKRWREVDGKLKPSLTWAMNDSVMWWFWSAGIMKVIGDTAQITSPLVVKAIINFATESYSTGNTAAAPPIGLGVGLAFVLLVMQVIVSLCTHHTFYRSMSTGVLLRGGLITAIYSKSMKLTSLARSTLTNGKLVNHISTDVSRVDFCCAFFHIAWAAPIQLIVCLIILLLNLGPSALAGFGFLILLTPLQTYAMKVLFNLRRESMHWTDKRAKLLQELLGGMKIIKFFGWEIPFLKRIFDIRRQEMMRIKSLLLLRSGNTAIAMSMPVLAAVLSFVTYSLVGHTLNAAVIFTSLTLFNLLRLPLMMLPMALSSVTDGMNAVQRLSAVFDAEEFGESLIQDPSLADAVIIDHAEFQWDSVPPEIPTTTKVKRHLRFSKIDTSPAKTTSTPALVAEPFHVRSTTFTIPRGQLVAIVGPVGAGKSSLLQGLIGEMRMTSGTVKFGGSLSYCPQIAWIQNATIRENICFGKDFDEERYWRAVEVSCLNQDLDMLPNGDLTEVGEKGISLSGGQKQRINICRVVYSNAEIEIFDDPLSALDAHVGKSVFENALRHNPDGKTRILVTHALHFLPQVDYILTVVDGHIAERGSYHELMANKGNFAKFYAEFESTEESKEEVYKEEEAVDEEVDHAKAADARKKMIAGAGIMQTEERNTGAIGGKIYKEYLKAGNGKILVPLVLMVLILLQGAQVMSSYWLVFWQTMHFNQGQAFYMGVYASLGIAQAILSFIMGAVFSMLTYYASQNLHEAAIKRVMHAPMSFFETTPLGRIMNRFSKDIDTIDSLLGDSIRMFANTLSTIIGAVILIAIILPWFLIAVLFVSLCYVYAGMFYRESARELKRLDAILRSSVYSHFSESLSGLPTIRAYRETERFQRDNETRIDIENRAYWLTVVNQRWLGFRIDSLGSLLTFVVAILTVAKRFTISPAQTGVVLSYILSIQQTFGWMVRQSAELENNMNSVERVVHYASFVEQEAPQTLMDAEPQPESWPTAGRVEFKDVVLKYRPELPAVLKGLSIGVAGGEKIGIVGRTGAGKSSIMTALFRIVEVAEGQISIDGIDLANLGLMDVRRSMSIIPQDPLLFSGTIRSNLDPFGQYEDVILWDALKRSYLVEDEQRHSVKLPLDSTTATGSSTPTQNRITLDTAVEDEGNNLSIGQRSLVSLARALVRNSKVLVLDEATASVDYETDRKIQVTIADEFKDRTILCIAHRLRTIISYDRICVMDAGKVVEFDTPEALYRKKDGIFYGMCLRSSIMLEDIRSARKAREAGGH